MALDGIYGLVMNCNIFQYTEFFDAFSMSSCLVYRLIAATTHSIVGRQYPTYNDSWIILLV
jgi:hypothetical protein